MGNRLPTRWTGTTFQTPWQYVLLLPAGIAWAFFVVGKFPLQPLWMFRFRDARKTYLLGPVRNGKRLEQMLAEHGVATTRTWFGF